MNWKLIFQLSLFGLAMGIATVYFIPSDIEPFFWLAIFLICAYIIAKKSRGNYFFTGLMVSMVNSVWISAAHIICHDAYIARHAREAAMYNNHQLPVSPKLAMLLIGLVIGLLSGLILGLFAFIASKIVKK